MQIGTGEIPACRLLCSAGRALRAFSRRGIEFPIRAVRTLKTTRVAIIAATCLLTGGAAQAHEKWFYEGPRMPLRWDLLSRPMLLGFLAGVAVLLGVSYAAWKFRGRRDFIPGPEAFGARAERRMAFYGLVPAILGLHIAVPLLVEGVLGRLFSPNNAMAPGYAHFIGLGEVLVGLCLFYGGMARLAAMALAAIWLAGMGVVGPEPMLENLHYLGFAGFFFLAGRGPIAVDRLLFPRLEPPAWMVGHAPTALRAGVGLSLAIVGVTEKLGNLPLAGAFLKQYPFINFTSKLGIPMSDELFALCAGSVEVYAGLMILFGIFPRTIILVTLFPLNLSLTVFNWGELVGHLPYYGSLAFLLVWTPRDRDLWVDGLRLGPLACDPPPIV